MEITLQNLLPPPFSPPCSVFNDTAGVRRRGEPVVVGDEL